MATKLISFDESTLLFQRCLRIIGVLPNDYPARQLLFVYFLGTSLIHCSMFVVHWMFENPATVETIYETISTLGINGRFYILLTKRREFSRLMEECAELWDICGAGTQSLMIIFEHKVRKLFWFLFGCTCSINVLYSVSAIYVNHLVSQTNGTKMLPYHWYGVQNVESLWIDYKYVFTLQVFVIYNAGLISATVDTALPLLMLLCCGYLQLLCKKLENITEQSCNDPVLADYKLVECCNIHQRILNLCSKVDECGQFMFLVELATSGYVLSLGALKLASSDPQKYKYIPTLCLLAGHVLICQWAPDLLMDESQKVSTAVYSTSYAFMTRPSRKYVTLMIQRAQKPLLMTASGFIILSLENYGKILSSVASFFMTMRNITNL